MFKYTIEFSFIESEQFYFQLPSYAPLQGEIESLDSYHGIIYCDSNSDVWAVYRYIWDNIHWENNFAIAMHITQYDCAVLRLILQGWQEGQTLKFYHDDLIGDIIITREEYEYVHD